MTQLFLACINAKGETVKYGKLNEVDGKYFLDASAEEMTAHVAYLKSINSAYHDFSIIGEDELDKIIKHQQNVKYNIGKLVAITLEEYESAYESVPPINYTRDHRGSSFCFREPLVDNIHTFYIVREGKYYKINMIGSINHEAVITKQVYC